MPKLSQKTITRIQQLYEKDVPLTKIASSLKVSYGAVYNNTVIAEMYGSSGEYKNNLARQAGFKSYSDQRKQKEKQKQKNPLNRKLKKLVSKRKKELGMSYFEIARKTGVSHTLIYLYSRGSCIPTRKRFRKLCSALELPYKTLDDLLRA